MHEAVAIGTYKAEISLGRKTNPLREWIHVMHIQKRTRFHSGTINLRGLVESAIVTKELASPCPVTDKSLGHPCGALSNLCFLLLGQPFQCRHCNILVDNLVPAMGYSCVFGAI